MNAGFSSLTALKAQILAPALRADTRFDTRLRALGLGAAAAIAGHLGRQLGRVAGNQHVVPADTALIALPRYPVELITALETRASAAEAWVDALPLLHAYDPLAGLVHLTGEAGPATAQARVTYTAGYWWDDSEEGTGTPPSGAARLPDALLTAWHLTVEEWWRASDVLGTQIVKDPGAGVPAAARPEGLGAAALTLIAPYRRLAL